MKEIQGLVDGRMMEAASYPPPPNSSETPRIETPRIETPRASFHFFRDSGLISEGPHDIAIRIVPHEGEPRLFGERGIFMVHP